MASQADVLITPTPPAPSFGTVNGISLGDRIKITYDSFEEFAKATLELNKARLSTVKPMVAQGFVLTAVAHALVITIILSLALIVSSVAEEAWGWSSRGAWAFTLGLAVLSLGGVLLLLRNVIEKGKTTWKPK